MAIAKELGLPRSEASEAILTTTPSGQLAELDQVVQAFSGALMSPMASIFGPGHSTSSQAYNLQPDYKAIPMQGKNWRKHDNPNRLSRSDLVSLKLAELKASSSPSRPLCFKCGDPGHIANQCRNETLCFVCNRFGHSSMECRSMTTHIPVSPQSTQLQYHQARSWPNQQSLPSEILIMDSIMRLATELTTIKHELVLLKKRRDAMEIDMAGINFQFRRIQCTLAEIEQASKTDYQQPQKVSDNDNGFGKTNKGNTPICTNGAITIGDDPSCNLECNANMDKNIIEVEKHQSDVHQTDSPTKTVETFTQRPAGSTNKDCRTVFQVVATQNLIQTPVLSTPAQTQPNLGIVPAQRVARDVSRDLVSITSVDHSSWISQIARTKFMKKNYGSRELIRSQIAIKIKSDSKEMNRVTLSREKRSINFKRTTTKSREKREVKLKPTEIAAIQLALLLAMASGNTNCFTVRRGEM